MSAKVVVLQQRRRDDAPPSPTPFIVDMRGKLPTRWPGADYSRRPISGIAGVDLHYTAGSPSSTVQAIAAYQVGPNAQEQFPAIAYTLIVDGKGVVYRCHDLDRRVWHNGAPGRNESRVGICYIGNVEPNTKQKVGLLVAILDCERQLGRKLAVNGHKDHYATSCPGPTWPQWRDEVTP